MKFLSTKENLNTRRILLKLIGLVLLFIGALAAFFGPLEMYVFTMFSEGGRFHYEGFRFGSLMFGNLAAQIMGYYFIAALLIPLGYGTFKLRNWARHLSLAVMQFWVVGGIPLICAFFFVLISSKQPSIPFAILVAVLLGALYLLLPTLVRRFYYHPETISLFNVNEPDRSWIESIPIPLLTVSLISVFFILILHTQIYFNGLFPLFGKWITGLNGIILLDISILGLILLVFGMLRSQPWAWWLGMIYYCLMTLTYISTLLTSSWMDILSALNLPPYELGFLVGMPLHGAYFIFLAGPPFILTIYMIIRSRKHFP
jgi:hypothetical protein